MLIDIDTNDKYFVEEFEAYGGDMSENLTNAQVVGVSKIEATINNWYSFYADGEDVIEGSASAEVFIKELLKTGQYRVWVSNCGGSYDDPSSFGLVVTELALYKERKLKELQDQIKEIEALA